MVKISVIIPVYNKEKYIRTILEQISGQSLTEFECIIIDDGSIDKSGQICDEVAYSDSRYEVIHIENAGVSNARNVGLNKAVGEYVTFIDADDTVDIDYLKNLYDCASQNKAELIISSVYKVWEGSAKREKRSFGRSGYYSMEQLYPEFAQVQQKTGIYGICVAKLIKRTKIADVRFNKSLKLAEDFDFYIQLYDKINGIFFDDKALYYYLQESDNSSVAVNDKDIDYLAQIGVQIRFKDMLIKHSSYFGTNKEIVERNISSYCYLALHYTNYNNFLSIFDLVYRIVKKDDIALCSNNVKERIVFFLLKRDMNRVARGLVTAFWFLRRIIRNERK